MSACTRLMIALACVAAAVSGCATVPSSTSPLSATPTAVSPAPLPGNVFTPETPHYFGSGGP